MGELLPLPEELELPLEELELLEGLDGLEGWVGLLALGQPARNRQRQLTAPQVTTLLYRDLVNFECPDDILCIHWLP